MEPSAGRNSNMATPSRVVVAGILQIAVGLLLLVLGIVAGRRLGGIKNHVGPSWEVQTVLFSSPWIGALEIIMGIRIVLGKSSRGTAAIVFASLGTAIGMLWLANLGNFNLSLGSNPPLVFLGTAGHILALVLLVSARGAFGAAGRRSRPDD